MPPMANSVRREHPVGMIPALVASFLDDTWPATADASG